MSVDIRDRVEGSLFGAALGDAVGLSTEFLTKAEVPAVLDAAGRVAFPAFPRNQHSMRWREGDWTDDTDQMVLIMDALVEAKRCDEGMAAAACGFATRLLEWGHHGFPELGDQGGLGIGRTVYTCMTDPEFTRTPHAVAEKVWESMNRNAAANGGVMRTAATGLVDLMGEAGEEAVVQTTRAMCRVTHHDTRCIASCLAIAIAVRRLARGDAPADALQAAIAAGRNAFGPDADARHVADYERYASAKTVQELQLDEPAAIGYTFKTMGAGLWGLRQLVDAPEKDFKTTIEAVVKEAGDADTNAAVCGAVLGAHIGLARLPADWLGSLLHREWLQKRAATFIDQVVLP